MAGPHGSVSGHQARACRRSPWPGSRPGRGRCRRVGRRRGRAGGGHRARLRHHRGQHLGRLVRGTEQREVVQVERPQVELDQGPGDRTGHDVPAAAPQHAQQRRPARAADHVHDDVDGVGAHLGQQVGDAVDDLGAPRSRSSGALSHRATATTDAPRRPASCTAAEPTPPDPPVTSTRSPAVRRRDGASFSAVDVAHGMDAERASVQSHDTANASDDRTSGTRRTHRPSPSRASRSRTARPTGPAASSRRCSAHRSAPGRRRRPRRRRGRTHRRPGCVAVRARPTNHPRRDQPVRVLMSVLFTPAAPIRSSTSPGAAAAPARHRGAPAPPVRRAASAAPPASSLGERTGHPPIPSRCVSTSAVALRVC